MSLNKESLQHIAESANIPQLLEQVKAFDRPAVVLPANYNMKDAESFMNHRFNYRGKMKTNSMADFFEYCKKYQADESKCFVSDEMYATTIFDMGSIENPQHQEHSAIVSLKKTSDFKCLLGVDGGKLSQQETAEFIEDMGHLMTIVTPNGESITSSQAATRLRKISIEEIKNKSDSVGNYGHTSESLESLQAKDQDSLPAFISYTCVPYTGLSLRTFKLRVSILTGHSKPILSLKIIQLDKDVEDMAEEFKGIIAKGLEETTIDTFIGSFSS